MKKIDKKKEKGFALAMSLLMIVVMSIMTVTLMTVSSSCHSVYGDGNSLAGYPSLAGQQIGYLTSTLKAYRSKERNEGEGALVMQSIAENLSDDEIEALANYMHGIYK